jgi:hypothetical protein
MIDLAISTEPEKFVNVQVLSRSPAGDILLRRTSFLKTEPNRFHMVFKLAGLEIVGVGDTITEAAKAMNERLHHYTRESEAEFRGRCHKARARHEHDTGPQEQEVVEPEGAYEQRIFRGW